MKRTPVFFEQVFIFSHLLRWTLLVIPVSILTGSLVALFLWLLDEVTRIRLSHPSLLFFLPLAGVFIYFLYKYAGRNSEAGNNLIMDEIHEPGGGVPLRMAPLVLITTIITHLFGGSAGREGTAVQIGGSLAQWIAKKIKLSRDDIKILLMTGIAAGFGAVFGTPVAGAIFAMEVLALGTISYHALLPCFIASLLSDIVSAGWGIKHTLYQIEILPDLPTQSSFFHFDFRLMAIVILASIFFGLASLFFAELSHSIKSFLNNFVKIKWLIPMIGGGAVIGLTYLLGTRDYLGLGVYNPEKNAVSILSCFHAGGAHYFSWFWKILFTAFTLSSGFKGGEVTPLFFIGAALGNSIAMLTGAPVDLMAGLGLIAVFAGASNTPIACTLMGVELFGGQNAIYFAVACFTAYYFSGHSGIYQSQRISHPKGNGLQDQMSVRLRQFRENKNKNE